MHLAIRDIFIATEDIDYHDVAFTITYHNSKVTPARSAFSKYSLRNLYGRLYPPLDPVAYSKTTISIKLVLFVAVDDAVEDEAAEEALIVPTKHEM
jgi:hypothetical protein